MCVCVFCDNSSLASRVEDFVATIFLNRAGSERRIFVNSLGQAAAK